MDLPWWLSWLDRGALINDATECGTSVVRGPTGHKWEGFHPVPKGFLAESAYFSSHINCRVLIK